MFSNQTELHDLQAENERLKAEVERQRKEINDACASLTMISLCATDGTNLITLVDAANDTAGDLHQQLAAANAKIAELEQSATTLRQLEELLREGWTVVYRIVRDAPVFFVYHQNHLVNPDEFCESTIPAAIAAAYAAKEE